jgi:hypothetical protein
MFNSSPNYECRMYCHYLRSNRPRELKLLLSLSFKHHLNSVHSALQHTEYGNCKRLTYQKRSLPCLLFVSYRFQAACFCWGNKLVSETLRAIYVCPWWCVSHSNIGSTWPIFNKSGVEFMPLEANPISYLAISNKAATT